MEKDKIFFRRDSGLVTCDLQEPLTCKIGSCVRGEPDNPTPKPKSVFSQNHIE